MAIKKQNVLLMKETSGGDKVVQLPVTGIDQVIGLPEALQTAAAGSSSDLQRNSQYAVNDVATSTDLMTSNLVLRCISGGTTASGI